MVSAHVDRLKETVKKYTPDMLCTNWVAIAFVDTKIRCTVALMRKQGKSDDEILKVIEPIFEECMMPLLNRE